MSDLQQNLFLSTCCNPCLLNPLTVKQTKLSTCLGCNLVLYCSTAHQKLDWPIHRRFCKAVSSILADNKIKHLFELNGPIESLKGLSMVTVRVKYLLVTALKRYLESHEEELTSFPVLCATCFSIKPNNLYQCKVCNAVSYCCTEHEQKDSETHQKDCAQLKIHYCKFKIEASKSFKLKLQGPCNLIESDLTNAMTTMYAIESPTDPCDSLADYQKFSFISNFSCVATVSYFLKCIEKDYPVDKEFTIYVAGSTADDTFFEKTHVEFFFDSFPEVTKLNVVFIGPEVSDSATIKTTTDMGKGRSLYRTSHKGTLENFFLEHEEHFKLNLVVCFNCGFSENAIEDEQPSEKWYKGIKHFMHLPELPILFTSYTNLEADWDYEAFTKVMSEINDSRVCLEKILEKQQNPYRDMRPFRSWYFNDPERIFFRNGYVQAVKVKFNEE